jgi:hypothetical protein
MQLRVYLSSMFRAQSGVKIKMLSIFYLWFFSRITLSPFPYNFEEMFRKALIFFILELFNSMYPVTILFRDNVKF